MQVAEQGYGLIGRHALRKQNAYSRRPEGSGKYRVGTHQFDHHAASDMPIELNRRRVIGRRLLLYAIVLILSVAFIQPSLARESESPHVNKSEAQAQQVEIQPQAEVETEAPKPEPIVDPAESKTLATSQPVAETVATPTPTPVPAGSCEDAIAKTWPAELQSGARLVALKESSLRADAIGAVNSDGSQDFGCFQINNRYHTQFFANGDWRDPTYNAQYALRLYQERGNWSAWYAVRGILW